ncbi:MAG: hypothetical protein R3F02_18800 [Thiolinea sp.]
MSIATTHCDPIRFVFGNAVRRGVLSVKTPLLSGQADYLANENRSRICQFPVSEPTVIECQLLNQRHIDAISLSLHNLSIHATVQFECLGNDGSVLADRLFEPPPSTGQLPVGTVWRVGIDPFDPPPPDAKPYPSTFAVWLDEPVTADRLRVTLYDPKAVGGYSRLGMLFAGQSVRLTRGFEYGAPLKALTDGEVTRSASGHAIRSKLRRHAKAWSVSLADMPDRDRQAIYAADAAYPNEPVLVSGYPSGPDWQQEQYNLLALVQQSPEYKHDYYQGHSTALNLLEV